MTEIGFSGFQNGDSIDMDATQGGLTKTVTGTQPTRTPPATDHVMTLGGSGPVQTLKGITGTTSNIGAGRRASAGFGPPEITCNFKQDITSLNEISGNDILNIFNSVSSDFWVGGHVETLREDAQGALVTVRTSTINQFHNDFFKTKTNGDVKTLSFDSGQNEIHPGKLLTTETPGDEATIQSVTLQSGTWAGGDAAGSVVITGSKNDEFEDNEPLIIQGGDAIASSADYLDGGSGETRLDFITGLSEFVAGETITGGTSGATAEVVDVVVSSGGWETDDAEGYLVITSVVGTFQIDDDISSPTATALANGPVTTATSVATGTWHIGFQSYNRGGSGAPRYYVLRAYDAAGNYSDDSATVTYILPDPVTRAPSLDGPTTTVPKGGVHDPAIPAPTNPQATLAANGGVDITCTLTGAAVGFDVRVSDTDPANHVGIKLVMDAASTNPVAAQGAQYEPGDYHILRYEITRPRRAMLSNTKAFLPQAYNLIKVAQFGNQLLADDDPLLDYYLVEDHPDSANGTGRWKLVIEQQPGAPNAVLTKPWFAGSSQTFYDVLVTGDPYVWSMWVKADQAATANFNPALPSGNVQTDFNVTTSWQNLTSTPFSLLNEYTGKAPKSYKMTFAPQVSAITWEVASPRLHRTADTPFAISDARAQIMSSLRLVRSHQFIKRGTSDSPYRDFFNSGGEISSKRGNTFPQFMEGLKRAGELSSFGNQPGPWWQLPMNWPEEGYTYFVDWFCGDAGTSAAADLRVSQGRTAPWIDLFEDVALELDNETWNIIFFPSNFDNQNGGTLHGQMITRMIRGMKASANWSRLAAKAEIHIGGWVNGGKFNLETIAAAPDATHLDFAGYLGTTAEPGNSEKPPPPGYTLGSLYRMLNSFIPLISDKAGNLIEWAGSLKYGNYESGPGYSQNGLNGQSVSATQKLEQERVKKSVGHATVTLDGMLRAAVDHGYDVNNFFTLGPGDLWASYAPASRGGGVYPSFQVIEFLNNYCLGPIYRTEAISSDTRTVPAGTGYSERADRPTVSAYVTWTQGGRMCLILCNLVIPFDQVTDPDDIADGLQDLGDDGSRTVTYRLPDVSAQTLTRWEFTNPVLAHNWDGPASGDPGAEAISLSSSSLTVPAVSNGTMDVTVTVPGGKPVFLIFDP